MFLPSEALALNMKVKKTLFCNMIHKLDISERALFLSKYRGKETELYLHIMYVLGGKH